MWILYCIIVLIVLGILDWIDNKENLFIAKDMFWIIMIISVLVLLGFPFVLNGENVKGLCNTPELIKEVKFIEVRLGSDGRYFYLDDQYNKKYPDRIEVSDAINAEDEIVKLKYKQSNWFIDDILFDFQETVLYMRRRN